MESTPHLKYSEAADWNFVVIGVVSSKSVPLISVMFEVTLLVVVFAIWSNCLHAMVFQGLSHEVHGKVCVVNDAKKNLRHQAIITL